MHYCESDYLASSDEISAFSRATWFICFCLPADSECDSTPNSASRLEVRQHADSPAPDVCSENRLARAGCLLRFWIQGLDQAAVHSGPGPCCSSGAACMLARRVVALTLYLGCWGHGLKHYATKIKPLPSTNTRIPSLHSPIGMLPIL